MTQINWEDDSGLDNSGRNPEGVKNVIEGALLRPDLSAAKIDQMLTKANVAHPKHYSTIVPVARHTVDYLLSSGKTIKVNGKLYRLVQVQPEPTLVKKDDLNKDKAA